MNNVLKKDQIFFYGLPGLPLAMLGLPLFVYLPSYYSKDLGLSLAAVGIALLLARSLDVITDPIIGLLNDRFPKFKNSLWRRKTYMIAGLPLLLMGLNFLLRPDQNVTALYLFSWSFVTYLGWTLINIPWLALGAEISQDYHEKSALASSREIFAVIGTVTVISLPVVLSIQSDLKTTLSILATLLTFLIPLALFPLLWSCKVSNNASNKISNTSTKKTPNKLFSKDSFSLLKHPAIKKLLPAYFINSIANALPATLFILYVSYVLQTPDQVGILLIAYFLAAIAGIPLWLYIARKTDKHISWCIALAGAILFFIWVPFLDAGDFTLFLIVCLGSGFCLGADVVMPASIQADISQDISQKMAKQDNHSQDSTALLFGLWGLLTKLSLALAIGIAFPILDSMGLSTNSLATQTANENASFSLIILYSLVPVVLKIWVLLKMWHFPFGKHFFNDYPPQGTCAKKGNNNENTETATNHRSITIISSYQRVQ